MGSRFEKYKMYVKENGIIVSVNEKAFQFVDESFIFFKMLYDTHYGSIQEDENLISIHTGGWSENEELIREFEETVWWFKYHKITATGGHYYFNTDTSKGKEWIVKINESMPSFNDFNKIDDLRQYLLRHPNKEMVKDACLHYLGDDAQKLLTKTTE